MFTEDKKMRRNNEGIVRLVRELVDQLEAYQEDVLEVEAEKQPHDIGDDRYEIAVTCRKAKKLLAIHDREDTFEKECADAFKEIKEQRSKLGLNPLSKNKALRNVTVEDLSELMNVTDNLANLLRKALWNWRNLTNN